MATRTDAIWRRIGGGRLLTLAAGALLLGSHAASASLLGDVVIGDYLYPDQATAYDSVGGATASTTTVFNFANEGLSVEFTSTGVIVTNTAGGSFSGENSFNGLDLNIFSGPAITSAAIDVGQSSAAFATGPVVTFTSTDLFINLSGTCGGCESGTELFIDVNNPTSAVPEPASFAVVWSGLGLLAMLRRRSAI